MKIEQKKNTNRTSFHFEEDELRYSCERGGSSRSFSLPYTAISRDRETIEERNEWLRNVGLLWIALGAVFTVMSLMGDGRFVISLWLWIGAGCYAWYRLRSTRYIMLNSEKGGLLVIDDAQGDEILREIASRRAAQLRRDYDFMPEGDSPEQIRGRFMWLHREGALSDEDLAQRLAMLDAPESQPLQIDSDQRGPLLN